MTEIDYWKDILIDSCDEVGITLTREQALKIAEDIKISHDNYGLAFYSPPSSDRICEIEREYKALLEKKERELDAYKRGAETAIKRSLNLRSTDNVSINNDGEVYQYGGRITQIL